MTRQRADRIYAYGIANDPVTGETAINFGLTGVGGAFIDVYLPVTVRNCEDLAETLGAALEHRREELARLEAHVREEIGATP